MEPTLWIMAADIPNQSRSKVLKVWWTTAEIAKLDKVAAAHLLDRSALVRMLVAGEARRLFGDAKP